MSNKHELRHAELYADHQLKIFNNIIGKKSLPGIFQNNVRLQVRPATDKDFYVPPGLTNPAKVVENYAFDKEGCEKIACFPYKANLVPCDQNDSPQHIRIGTGYTMACQNACQFSKIDTFFKDGQCYVSNSFKKMLALAPEEYLGMKSKQHLHSGLDLENGYKLKLNYRYCHSFGTDFQDGDCTTSTGQYIAEILIGSTVFRTAGLAMKGNVPLPNLPPVPNYLLNKPRVKRSASNPSKVDSAAATPLMEIVKEVTAEVAVDYGVQVTTGYISNVLSNQIPRLVTKTAMDIPTKSAIIRAVLANQANTLAKISQLAGSSLKAGSTLLSVYGVAMMALDVLDPYEYNRVLTKDQVEKIDRQLDVKFFQSVTNFEVQVTPENFLNAVTKDQSEEWTYYSMCVDDYLKALHAIPDEKRPNALPTSQSSYFRRETHSPWPWVTIQIVGVGMLLILAFMFSNFVEYWSLLVFTFVLFVNRISA